jgi:2'-5' RNA ligase
MNLTAHYDKLYNDFIKEVKSKNYHSDNLIDSVEDNRLGITILIRPDSQVKKNIQTFLTDLKSIEPDQYYYRDSDIHITVLSIVSCYKGFDIAKLSVPDYVEIIKKSLTPHKRFKIEFNGITASSSCVMIQGFPIDNWLNGTRESLRINFKNSNLEQNIDQRYSIRAAHATVVRFGKQLSNPDELIRILNNYRQYYFGAFEVHSLELVCNDWYMRKEKLKELCRFEI